MSLRFDVQLKPLPPPETLAAWWRALEAQADTTFFTTWSWMACWLDVLPSNLDLRLLKATQGEKTVGLGIVVRGKATLMKHLPVACWRLHTTGVEELDELTIEYNGFLVDRQCRDEVTEAMLRHLLFKSSARRLDIDCSQGLYADQVKRLGKAVVVHSTARDSSLVDLQAVREAKGGYASLLSANTRSQLRRSMNAYQALGPLALHAAPDEASALAYLEGLRALHDQAWKARGMTTAFANSTAAHRFHESLIRRAFGRGEIQLLRITAGDQDLGYLYNFRYRGRIAFYQSGLRYGLLEKHDKPGMVCHALAVEHNAREGEQLYDFLAGNHRYKASLATHSEPQATLSLTRNGVLPQLDARLRDWRDRLRQKAAIVQESSTQALIVAPFILGQLPWVSPFNG
ncbi:MAG: GNAT family N-acetyltransferase [Aquabacterium sp.]